MIKKIKKYKLSLRPSYAARNLKKKLPETIPWQDTMEEDVKREISRLERLLTPSSIYETFSKADSPETLKALWNGSPKGAVSISLIATTIGTDVEREIASQKEQSADYQAFVIDAVAQEALEQSAHFVNKLLNEESKEEHCECTPSLPLEPVLFKDSLEILQSHKADIVLNDAGGIAPLYSSVSYCFWNPSKKH